MAARWLEETPWRVPAVLSVVALVALLASPLLGRFETGSLPRQAVALFLAAGACSMLLGLVLGAWIALRVRTLPALLVALGAAAVAFLWLWLVFDPLVGL